MLGVWPVRVLVPLTDAVAPGDRRSCGSGGTARHIAQIRSPVLRGALQIRHPFPRSRRLGSRIAVRVGCSFGGGGTARHREQIRSRAFTGFWHSSQ